MLRWCAYVQRKQNPVQLLNVDKSIHVRHGFQAIIEKEKKKSSSRKGKKKKRKAAHVRERSKKKRSLVAYSSSKKKAYTRRIDESVTGSEDSDDSSYTNLNEPSQEDSDDFLVDS